MKDRARPGLVALYDIRQGNGADQFLQPRSPHGPLIWGDFNAKVEVEVIAANGGMGLTGANETGECLPDFCLDHQLVLKNRCFTQHSRLYTWISPDKETKNQIDYITVSQKRKSSIRKS